jgi:hypothetical protein
MRSAATGIAAVGAKVADEYGEAWPLVNGCRNPRKNGAVTDDVWRPPRLTVAGGLRAAV